MELNPNHPTTSTIHDHWHKLAAILVNRTKEKATTITLDEISRVAGMAITIKETCAGLELRIVSMDEGQKLARQEGGLPV
jgi:hypothetical protein